MSRTAMGVLICVGHKYVCLCVRVCVVGFIGKHDTCGPSF